MVFEICFLQLLILLSDLIVDFQVCSFFVVQSYGFIYEMKFFLLILGFCQYLLCYVYFLRCRCYMNGVFLCKIEVNLVSFLFVLQLSFFFMEQLIVFEVWLEYGFERKKLLEQFFIVLQVLYCMVFVNFSSVWIWCFWMNVYGKMQCVIFKIMFYLILYWILFVFVFVGCKI